MSNHRKSTDGRARTVLSGALLAGGMLLTIPAAIASAGPGVNGRPPTPNDQPGVDAVQTAGDKVFDSPNIRVPKLAFNGSTVALGETGLGSTYHGLYGHPANGVVEGAEPSQGLIVGVANTFPRVVACNLVVQAGCNP